MTSKEILLQQHTACFNETNWFVPLTTALDGLTPEQASWNSGDIVHSIKQIVNHLIFWNEYHLNRFKEMPTEKITKENASTFNNIEDTLTWESQIEKIYSIMNDWKNVLTKAENEKLQSHALKKTQKSWYAVIANINIHNAFHIGQIIYIRKLQGSWDSDKGVK